MARRGQIGDIALWAVPAGLIGARLYHVATDHDLYFGDGRDPLEALEIWHGGLGIWGAIAGGLVGAWFYCRRHGILLRPLADALAPSLLLAQIIGRFGNYFNQELFGRPTDLPWGLEIDAAHRPSGYDQFATVPPDLPLRGAVEPGRDRRAALGRPPVPARLRPGVRALRDALHRWVAAGSRTCGSTPSSSQTSVGLRFNVWTSIVLFVLAAVYFVVATRRHPPSGHPRALAVPSRPCSGRPARTTPETAPKTARRTPPAGGHRGRDLSGPDRSGPEGSTRSEAFVS